MVACPHSLASAAGVEALRGGGSAVDAAIAAAAALGVIYPHMCGIGGDAFWLIYEAARKRVAYLAGGLKPVNEKDDVDPYQLSAEERSLLALLSAEAS